MADAIYVKASPRVVIRRGPPGPAGATGPQGPAGSSGSGTIDSTTNLIEGDGAGAGVDSTIDPADVITLLANTSGTNTGDQTNITGSAATAAALSVSGQTGLLTVTGLTSTNRAKAVRDAADTLLELGGSYTPTGTWTSMVLATPNCGTPTTLVGTNITGTAASLTAGSATTAATASAVAVGGITGLGTGVATSLAVNVGTIGAPVVQNGALGTPSSGTLTSCTFPTLNQNTTGSAASLSVSGQTGLVTVTGLVSTNRVKTLRDAADTILELGGSYTPTGTWTNLTMVNPTLGTPASGDLSNCTGVIADSVAVGDITGLGTGVATALAINVGSSGAPVLFNGAGGTPSSMTATNLSGTAASLTVGTASAVAVGGITGLGTGVGTALAVNVGSAGAPVLFDGAGGTPSSMTATNLSGTAASLTAGNATTAAAVAVGGITGLGTGVATALAINVGSAGALVVLNGAGGTPSSLTGTNITGTASGLTAGTASAVAVGGITGLGTGVATALAVNVGAAGAPVVFNGALGTPSTGTLTNCTSLPVAGITASTSTALGVGSIELGHATANTLTGSGGVLSVEGVAVPTISSTNTFTNKRITPRVLVTNAPSSAPTINTDNYDCVSFTGISNAITNMSTNLSGTPNNFDKLIFRFLDDGTARAISWGASFVAKGVALPTTTVISKELHVGFISNGTTWGCVASAQEA